MKWLHTEDNQHKFAEGAGGYINLRPRGLPKMGNSLGQWFALTLFVSLLATVTAAIALPIGAAHEPAFDITFLVTFAAYGCGSISGGIWKGQTWRSVAIDLLDAFIYAAVTGVAFALLWPR